MIERGSGRERGRERRRGRENERGSVKERGKGRGIGSLICFDMIEYGVFYLYFEEEVKFFIWVVYFLKWFLVL